MSRTRVPVTATVVSTSRLAPQMVRITVEAEPFRQFGIGEFTDHYVKLQFPPAGAPYEVPFDPAEVKRTLPREHHHRQRTFTVRDFDRDRGRLTIDIVVHGDEGIAGPWAAGAAPGDLVQLIGPGGAYAPDPDADWHLMAGDEAVIPAISVSLGRIPAGRPVFVVIEAGDEGGRLPLETGGELTARWLYRHGTPQPERPRILDAVRDLELPPGRGQAFIHGEAGMVMAVRRHLLTERGLRPADLSATGYWKYRRTEEGWREDKPGWKQEAERDLGNRRA